jgi:hypothetical protein
MATYKVIQDIEAEDKLFGPLTFKQMVFFLGGALFAWLNFLAIAKGFAVATIFFTPPMLLGFFLCVPWSKDQPTEVWVLAKLRFKFKPKKRIWSQSGMEELVTITAPKKIEKMLTDNLSQLEVRSRLEALAQTIDSRGWAIKHAQLDPSLQLSTVSDRLVSPSILPQEVPTIDLSAVPDIMEAGTPTFSNFDRMIQQSSDMRLKQNLNKLDRLRDGESIEDVQQAEIHFTPPAPASNESPLDENAISAELKSRRRPDVKNRHLRTIQPFNPYAVEPSDPENSDSKTQNSEAQASIPNTVDAAIINEYAGRDDLTLDTLSRQAKKDIEGDDNEVVVSLR